MLELTLSGDLLYYFREIQLYNAPSTYLPIEQESCLTATYLVPALQFVHSNTQLSCVKDTSSFLDYVSALISVVETSALDASSDGTRVSQHK